MIAEQLTVVDAQSARDEAQREVDRLFNRQSELTAQIQECADQAREGNSAGASRIPALAQEKGECDRMLKEAEAQFAGAVQELAEVTAAENRKRFDTVIRECKDRRVHFAALFRELCLELGSIIDLQTEALKLFPSHLYTVGSAENQITQADALAKDALAEINQPLGQAEKLCGGFGGLVPDFDRGWRLAINVVPLHKPKGTNYGKS